MITTRDLLFAHCPALALVAALWLAWRSVRDFTFAPTSLRHVVGVWGGLFLSAAVFSALVAGLAFSGWRYAAHLLAAAAAAGVMYLPLSLSRDFSDEADHVPLCAFAKSAMSVGVCFAALAGLIVLRLRA